MNYLDATDHLDELATLNAASQGIQVRTALSAAGRSLVSADALADLEYLAHFAEWYLKLPPTDEVPMEEPPSEPLPG